MLCMYIAVHEPLVWLFLLLYRPEMKTSGGWLRLASRESTYYVYVYKIAPAAGLVLDQRTVYIHTYNIYIICIYMYMPILCICIYRVVPQALIRVCVWVRCNKIHHSL